MRTTTIATLASALALALPAFAQQFVQDATALPAQNVWTNGVALADVDGDDDLDILFANGSTYGAGGAQPQHLFLNDGTGKFTAAHAQLNVANFNASMVIAEDFDGDGDPDLMYAAMGAYPAPTQFPRMLVNAGNGVFSDQSASRLPLVAMSSFCVCAGDVDDDGDLDVCFTDGGTFGGVAAQARLYENGGTGSFLDATAFSMPADLYNAQDATLGDWEGDGDVDILLSGKGSSSLRSRLYVNGGTGTFSITPFLNAIGTGNTYEIDLAPLDGDGDLDLVVQSLSGFNEGWGRNDGTSVATTVFTGTNGGDDNEMASVDLDDDGDLDVVVGSLTATGEKPYRNSGGAAPVFTFATGVFPVVADSTLDLAFGDLDGNGAYDMVTAQGESGSFLDKVYLNQGPRDTRPPEVLHQTAPASVAPPATLYKLWLRDAVHDDGEISAGASLLFATDGASGVDGDIVKASPMGCGLFRAEAITGAFTASISSVWVGRDAVGNAAAYGNVMVGAGANGIFDLGGGLAGSHGVPVLAAAATLQAGTPGRAHLFSGPASSMTLVVAGLAAGNAPAFGGTVVPFPIFQQAILPTDAKGDAGFLFTWPAAMTGTSVYLQALSPDPGAAFGVSISNALRLDGQ